MSQKKENSSRCRILNCSGQVLEYLFIPAPSVRTISLFYNAERRITVSPEEILRKQVRLQPI